MAATAVKFDVQAQREAALKVANAVRIANADHKKRIRGMSLRDAVAEVVAMIAEPDGTTGRLRALELLTTIPKVGDTKARRWLYRSSVLAEKRLDSLVPMQRARLIRELETYVSCYRGRM